MAVRLLRPRAAKVAVVPAADPLPALSVHPEVLRTISAAAAQADRFEVGGPLFGTLQSSWDGKRFHPIASVLGTVPPSAAARGRAASVSLGDDAEGDRSSSALRWLRSTTNVDLVHLGDWHVHPSGLCRPSAGDVETAQEMLGERGGPCWVVAVAVSRCESQEEVVVERELLRRQDTSLQIADVRFFQTVQKGLVPLPVRIEDRLVPRLPPLPWHVADPVRFAAELRLLDAAGFGVAIDAGPQGLAGLSLRVQRDEGRALVVVTPLGFPEKPPFLYGENGRPVPLRGTWSPERFLIDVVREVLR